MQYLFLLFVWGASVVAAATFPPPPPPPQPGAWLSNIMLRSPWLLSPPPATETPAELEEEQEGVNVPYVFKPLTDAELQVYKDATKEKCINILIASEKHGYYYNGEPFEVSGIGPPDIFYNEARIAGDRLAYVIRRDDGQYFVVVDDEVVGRTSLIPSRSSMRIWLNLNEKHYAYIVQADYKEKEYRSVLHLNFDGKDLGEVVVPFGFRLNGDYVVYNKKTEDNAHHLYVNGKKVAVGAFGDFDGKNLGYQAVGKRESDAKLVLNGKKLGYGSDLTLKDGHRAYILGRTPNVIDPKVYYDGKVVGPGNEPVIEKNHLAYLRARNQIDKKSTDIRSKVIYDGKEYGYIANGDISLAGDSLAYVRLPDEYVDSSDEKVPVYININGKDFPGVFGRNTTYVQIAEKVDRSMCAM